MSDHLFIDRYFTQQGKKVPRNLPKWLGAQCIRTKIAGFLHSRGPLAPDLSGKEIRKALGLKIGEKQIRNHKNAIQAETARALLDRPE